LWIAVLYNLGGIALAATGWLHPVLAALLICGKSTVTWRALALAEKLQGHAEVARRLGPELAERVVVDGCVAPAGNLGPHIAEWRNRFAGLLLFIWAGWNRKVRLS